MTFHVPNQRNPEEGTYARTTQNVRRFFEVLSEPADTAVLPRFGFESLEC